MNQYDMLLTVQKISINCYLINRYGMNAQHYIKQYLAEYHNFKDSINISEFAIKLIQARINLSIKHNLIVYCRNKVVAYAIGDLYKYGYVEISESMAEEFEKTLQHVFFKVKKINNTKYKTIQ